MKYQKLVEQYSQLFEGGNKFHVECDIGWYIILETLFEAISWELKYLVDVGFYEESKFEISQIKEKLGSLRVYTTRTADEITGLIALAERLSYKICECCGSTKNVTLSKGSWKKSYCPDCIEKFGAN